MTESDASVNFLLHFTDVKRTNGWKAFDILNLIKVRQTA
jgi:hypothetical protein